MRSRGLLVLVVLAAVTAGGFATLTSTPPAEDAPSLGGLRSTFVVRCDFTHRAPDDPIVAPNTAAGSHLHDFFGNYTVDTSSTLQSLLAGEARCTKRTDRSGYWTPTLLVNGRAVEPIRSRIYYGTGGKRADTIEAPPNGLATVTGGTVAPHAIGWGCSDTTGFVATPRDCGDARVELSLRFPDCWDGERLDSVDHRSHLAFSSEGACPSSHPEPIPAVRFVVRYPISDPSGASFSSGGLETAHADLFLAWHRPTFTRLVDRCINHRAC